MNTSETEKDSEWQKTPYANLVRYKSSGIYFARFRVKGKLIRRSLKTSQISVAKLRLGDLEKQERQRAEHQTAMSDGVMAFADALAIYQQRLAGDGSLKPRSKDYREERIAALLKSWPRLAKTDTRKISKSECLGWAADYGRQAAPSNFNNTVGTLRLVLDIAVEAGALYDNPARFIKRLRVLPKKLQLPSEDQFLALVAEIDKAGAWCSRDCANLVRFLAFGGFRKGEAETITWSDCDFEKSEIVVRGDPETGTKNWSIRRVPMIPEMRQLLERLRAERTTETPQSPVMRVQECQGAINSACTKLGIARFTHHDLRHLFATRCIESGVDIPTVSRWLGHKDGGALAMKVYGHLRDQHSVSMAQRVTFGRASALNGIALPEKEASGR
ncbi:MAG TPA: site-specific integrase [Verrucomicrobiae bacterium]|jgi:integrase